MLGMGCNLIHRIFLMVWMRRKFRNVHFLLLVPIQVVVLHLLVLLLQLAVVVAIPVAAVVHAVQRVIVLVVLAVEVEMLETILHHTLDPVAVAVVVEVGILETIPVLLCLL